jgi:hypothetical protein
MCRLLESDSIQVSDIRRMNVLCPFFIFVWWGEPESTWYVGHYFFLLHQFRMIDDDDDDDECGAVRGMRIYRGNQGTRRKPAPVPLCLPQIPHDLTWARSRDAAMTSRRLTAWAMARAMDYIKKTVSKTHGTECQPLTIGQILHWQA